MFYILDLSFLLLSAIEFLRNSAIQVKFIIIIIIINILILTNPTASGYLVSKLKRGEDVMQQQPTSEKLRPKTKRRIFYFNSNSSLNEI